MIRALLLAAALAASPAARAADLPLPPGVDAGALTQPQREVLETAFTAFARQLGVQITASTRAVARVDYEAFVLVPYGVLAAQLEPSSGFVLGSLAGAAGVARLQCLHLPGA